MSSVAGWEGTIKFANRQFEEAVGIGDNVETQFDLDYPAADELGDITDDATKIEVFIDGVLQTPTTDYTLDGDGGVASVGQITFTAAPATDEVITASYYAYQSIGYVESIAMTHNNNIIAVPGIGKRLPEELKAGLIDISLTMSRAFIDLGLLSVSVHEISADRGWLASNYFDIEVFPKGTTPGNPLYTVRGKFNVHTLDFPHDNIAMDSVDMVGLSVTPTVAS